MVQRVILLYPSPPCGGPNIDATIKQLRATSRGVRHAAECPTFQGALKAAALCICSALMPSMPMIFVCYAPWISIS